MLYCNRYTYCGDKTAAVLCCNRYTYCGGKTAAVLYCNGYAYCWDKSLSSITAMSVFMLYDDLRYSPCWSESRHETFGVTFLYGLVCSLKKLPKSFYELRSVTRFSSGI